MENKSVFDLKRLVLLTACICFLGEPVLAGNGAADVAERAGFDRPPSSGTESFSWSREFNLVSAVSSPDVRNISSLDLEAQVVQFSDLRPYIKERTRSQGAGRTLFNVSLMTMVGLHAADYYSTIQALKYPQCQEANPLMKPIVSNHYVFAGLKLGIALLSYGYLRSLYKKNPVLGWVASTLTNGLLAYAVVNNINVIQKVRRLQP